MKIREKIRNESFVKAVGFGEMGPQEALSIFHETSSKLFSHDSKSDYLLYPVNPRELEVRQIMCELLSNKHLYHMIECPIYSPMQKLKNRTSFVDLSIFLCNGIVDIEFKESISDIQRDFPNLLSPHPYSMGCGCASYYLYKGTDIDSQLPVIIERFQSAYQFALDLRNTFSTDLSKWYIVYLVAMKEKRIFYQVFENLQDLDFSLMTEKP